MNIRYRILGGTGIEETLWALTDLVRLGCGAGLGRVGGWAGAAGGGALR